METKLVHSDFHNGMLEYLSLYFNCDQDRYRLLRQMDQSKNYPFCLTKKKEEMFKWARYSMFGMTATVAKKRSEEMVDYEQLLNSGKN